MSRRDFEPLVRGGGDELVRDVLGSARADAPPPGARKQVLAKLASSPSPRPSWRSPFWRSLTGRAALHGLGLVVTIGAASLMASFMSESNSARGDLRASSEAPALNPVVVVPPSTTPPSSPSSLASADVPTAAEPSPSPASPQQAALSTKVTPRVAPPVHRTEAASAASSAEAPDDSTLGREVLRVKAARSALAAGDAAHTLRLLDQYDAEFPSGAFSLEVSVLRIEALARSGRIDEARRLGDRFLAQQPQGAFARRVTATLRSVAPLE